MLVKDKLKLTLYIFIYLSFVLNSLISLFGLLWVFKAAHGLSLSGATVRCGVWASHPRWVSCCTARALEHVGSGAVAQGPSCSMAGGVPLARARTHVPCIGRQISIGCATRNVLNLSF